jgi:hypothetical protein
MLACSKLTPNPYKQVAMWCNPWHFHTRQNAMHPDMALVQGYETLAGKRGGGGLRKIHEIPSISQTSLQKKKLVMKYLLHGLQGFENWIQNRGGGW